MGFVDLGVKELFTYKVQKMAQGHGTRITRNLVEIQPLHTCKSPWWRVTECLSDMNKLSRGSIEDNNMFVGDQVDRYGVEDSGDGLHTVFRPKR